MATRDGSALPSTFGAAGKGADEAIRARAAFTRDLADNLGGLHGGNLIVIAGRPGMSKSVAAASLARQAAEAGAGIGLFSLKVQISARILADHVYSDVNPLSFKQAMEGKGISHATFGRIVAAQPSINKLPLEVDTSPTLTVSNIGARTYAMGSSLRKRGFTLRAIFIDYLKYVRASDRYRGQRVYEGPARQAPRAARPWLPAILGRHIQLAKVAPTPVEG